MIQAPRRTIVLGLLAATTVACVGVSRLATPTGVAEPVRIQAATGMEGNAQVSGYIDIPSSGTTRLGFTSTSAHNTRLVLDGRVIAESAAGGETLSSNLTEPGPRRLLLQFDGGDTPTLRWERSGRAPERIPRAALSPRHLSSEAWALRRTFKPVALALSLLWMMVGLSAVVGRVRTALANEVPDSNQRRAIWLTCALCFAVYACPVWWGLPAGWAQDEVVPLGLEGLRDFMAPGHFEKYPPLHTYVMALFHLPILVASSLDLLAVDDELVYAVMRGTGRLLTAVMAVATLGAIYVCVRRALSSHAVAMWTAILAGLTVPIAYYGKTSNLDVPYVFWFALALIAYQSALQTGEARHHVAFAAAAACAVTTKDQAYGLFVLPTVHLVWTRLQQVRARGSGVVALVMDRALGGALCAGLLTCVLVYNLPRNWSGFTGHFQTITGLASEGYRMVDSTSLSGQLWLLGRTLHQIGWSFGWPASALVVMGVVVAIRSWRQVGRPLVPFVIPALSYYVVFMAVVGYTYDRFVIPLCLLLSVFGGIAFERLRSASEGAGAWSARLVRVAAVALVAYMFARVLSVDMLMAFDSRNDARQYMLSSLPAGTMVCYVEDGEILPFLGGFRTARAFDPSCGAVVVTDKFPERYAPGSPANTWYGQLLRGELGYQVAFRRQNRAALGVLRYEKEIRRPDPSFSVIHKVNPLVTVLVAAAH